MYRDKTLAPEERAKALLSEMTLDDKFDQMHIYGNIQKPYDFMKNGIYEARSGTFQYTTKEMLQEIQEYAINNTKLGIPLLSAIESLHGVCYSGATAFPQCAGLGGSFDEELVGKMADIIGYEARALGLRQVYAPDVDTVRDPRWGRTQESYGEDPYLNGVMGSAYVRGIQKHNVAACVKHYTGYGVGEGGMNLAPAHVGEREMREVMIEPFKMCIEAGAMSIMPAYNEIDGIPVHASKKVLRLFLGTPVYSHEGAYKGNITDGEVVDFKLVKLFTDQEFSFPLSGISAYSDAVILKKSLPYPIGQRIPAPAVPLLNKFEPTVTRAVLKGAIENEALIRLTLSLAPFSLESL